MGDFTIQISAELVNLLTDDGKKKTKKPKTKISREYQRTQRKASQKQISDDSETHKGTAAAGWPIQPPFFLPPVQSSNAELDAIRLVLQESERVVEKLRKQEEHMVQEVTERAKNLRDKEFKLPNQKPMPCMAENDAWQACYKEHAKEPLKCQHLVQNFANCARRVRQLVNSDDK
ncbi:hypothetical protein CFOL_v3_15198 [Cephalotus follicularis]|uniref:CHCH domain-containing protein n=1 Tax=Cephalotus follicularis TaxID=3775 RepID=A0A1Q3BV15_CEPFO|nr:hypothetical protein CFOL_v3_15198 [Cephalotus follicularis]